MTKTILLKLLLGLELFAPDKRDDPNEQKARLSVVAEELAAAKLSRESLAALLTLGERETHFARYVGEGRCQDGPKGARCDPDSKGQARARSYWQFWRSTMPACQAAWSATPGSREELRASIRCAAGHWQSAYSRCKSGPLGAFSGYRGAACDWEPAHARARRYERILAKL